MNLRRLLGIVPMLFVAASAVAQLTADQKNQVLDEMDQVLSKEAFVPGVDLGKFRGFLDARKERLDAAESPRAFTMVVNSALREFGLSHIMLVRDRFRTDADLSSPLVTQRGRMSRQAEPELSWIEDGAALLSIPNFEGSYDETSVAHLMSEAKDAKYLILDLRGNPGGEVGHMRHFLGFVMSSTAPIGTFVTRRMAQDYAKSEGPDTNPVTIAKWAQRELRPLRSVSEPFKGKIAVLVDKGSASAAEIIANALHETNRSIVVGSPTAGAVLVSTFDRLSFGFRMQFPVGDYVSHDGHRLEGHPLTPDINAAGSTAVDSALAKLKSG